jgi:hypothetical protein
MPLLYTITWVKPVTGGRLNLTFNATPNKIDLVDLSAMLAQGGVFEPLRDPARFATVEIGPRGRTLLWRVGEDVVDLCADALWLMAVMPEQRQEPGDREATQQARPVELSVTTPVNIEASARLSGVGMIHVDTLDRVEEALRKLRPQVEAALIDNAEAELKVVRADPASPQKQNGLISAMVKIAEWLTIRAADAGMREAIHELFKSLLGF